MSCGCDGPTPAQPEFTKQWKPENNSGCCTHGVDDCDKPSLAREGSALWEWEQVHGKLLETISYRPGSDGRMVQVVEKKPCHIKPKPRRTDCTSLSYKVSR